MISMVSASAWRTAAVLQAGLWLGILPALAFAPPAHGRTILVPVGDKPVSEALLERSRLHRVGPGPLPGSVVVHGPGNSLAAAFLRQGIVMLAAPESLCGGHRGHGGA